MLKSFFEVGKRIRKRVKFMIYGCQHFKLFNVALIIIIILEF